MRHVAVWIFSLLACQIALGSYPVSELSRPLTLPSQVLESSLSFNNTRFAQVGVVYGLTQDLQLGAQWLGVSARGLTPSRHVTLSASYLVFDSDFLRIKARADLPLFMQRTVVQETGFAMPTFIALVPEYLNLVVLEDLVTLGWTSEVNAQFRFPVRLSWQATQALSISVGTEFATVNTHQSRKEYSDTHIGQITPIRLQGLYGVTPDVDFYSSVSFDNIQNAIGLSAGLGVVVRGGGIG